eukprot:evm.model.scf_55.10 EVM.evm.TU.scf_55.10   scf_55:169737-177987(-)
MMYPSSPKPSQELRTSFKTPEGTYRLESDLRLGSIYSTMAADRSGAHTTLATVKGGEEAGVYLLINVGEALHVCPYNTREKDPVKVIYFNRSAYPTCHAFAPAEDDADLVVGLSNGEVVLLSLRQTLEGQAYQVRMNPLATYSPARQDEEFFVTAVTWAAGSNPHQFVATYSDGVLKIFDKVLYCLQSDSSFRSGGSNRGMPPGDTLDLGCGAIHDAAFSPDATKLAVVAQDGLLRVFCATTRHLQTGFQSYYGGLLCCAWSPDSRYIATGGEDDLVALFCVEQACVTAWGAGHNSWVTHVAFDPGEAAMPPVSPTGPNDRMDETGAASTSIYRVGSVGQDAQVALWDFEVHDIIDSPTTSGRPHSLQQFSNAGLPPVTAMTPQDSDFIRRPSAESAHEWTSSENGDVTVIAPAVPHREMTIIPPVMIHELHVDPPSSIIFTQDHMYTCDNAYLRCWVKPGVASAQPSTAEPEEDSLDNHQMGVLPPLAVKSAPAPARGPVQHHRPFPSSDVLDRHQHPQEQRGGERRRPGPGREDFMP